MIDRPMLDQLMQELLELRARAIKRPRIRFRETVDLVWVTLDAGPVSITLAKRDKEKASGKLISLADHADRALDNLWKEIEEEPK